MTTAVELSFDSYGDEDARTTLVVAHGLFGSSTNWRGVARVLGEHFRVLVVDMRNHGESPWADQHSYSDLGADLALFVNRHRQGKTILIGHSMGGKAAMTLALTSESPIDGLVVVDIAPVKYGHTHAGFIDAMRAVDLETISSRKDADAALSASIAEPPVRQFLLQNLVRHDAGWRWRINLDVLAARMDDLIDFSANESPVDLPTLFIYGTASGYVDAHAQQEAARLFTKSSFHAIEGAGHWVHAEQPRAVVDAIVRFAGSID